MIPLQMLLTSLGEVIRQRRTGAGYSQERFAFAIRRHRTFMGLLERGKANPTVKTLHLVAEGLGITVPELFALAAAETTGPAAARGDRAQQGKDPSKLVHRSSPSVASRKSPTEKVRTHAQKRRKPGK